MKKIANIFTGPRISRTINIIIYTLFVYFTYTFVKEAETLTSKIVIIVFTTVALVVVIYYEYLMYINQNAIKALNYDCDPEKCKLYLDKLEQKDIFKGFKKNRIVFNTVYYLATYQPDECIATINDNDKLFRDGVDALLIRNASLFLSYVELNNKSQAKSIFPELLKLKSAKVKGKKIAILYSWEEMEALYCLMRNDFKNSCRAFETVNTKYMNNREKSQYLYYYAKALKGNNKLDLAQAKYNELQKIANKLPVKNLGL
jgi:hypothetical protein